MLSYHTLKDKPHVLRALTSLEREEFETLLIPFDQAWQAYVTDPLRHNKARKRRYGGGRKPHLLAIEDKLYPLQEVIATVFDMSQGRAHRVDS